MTYLVDANVLSEPTKPRIEQKVADWIARHETDLVSCAPVYGEIWRGIHGLPQGKKKLELENWFQRLKRKVLSLDWTTESALLWAELVNRVKQSGHTIGVMDTQIASIAIQHGLTVATRNVADFTRCGVPVVNPSE